MFSALKGLLFFSLKSQTLLYRPPNQFQKTTLLDSSQEPLSWYQFYILVTFPVAMTKGPEKSNLRGRGFILAGFEVQAIVAVLL